MNKVSVCLSLSGCLSVSLSVCLLSCSLSRRLCVFVSLSLCLSVFLFIILSFSLSICLSVCVWLSVSLSIALFLSFPVLSETFYVKVRLSLSVCVCLGFSLSVFPSKSLSPILVSFIPFCLSLPLPSFPRSVCPVPLRLTSVWNQDILKPVRLVYAWCKKEKSSRRRKKKEKRWRMKGSSRHGLRRKKTDQEAKWSAKSWRTVMEYTM